MSENIDTSTIRKSQPELEPIIASLPDDLRSAFYQCRALNERCAELQKEENMIRKKFEGWRPFLDSGYILDCLIDIYPNGDVQSSIEIRCEHAQ